MKNKYSKRIVVYGLLLVLICVVTGISLARMVNGLTQKEGASSVVRQEDLKELMPLGVLFKEVTEGKGVMYYRALDAQGKFIGVVFMVSAKGYSSIIETIAGMSKEGVITAIKVLSQNETPHLGAGVREQFFTSRFKDKRVDNVKDVQAISGATISSEAVINSVKEKALAVQKLIKDE